MADWVIGRVADAVVLIYRDAAGRSEWGFCPRLPVEPLSEIVALQQDATPADLERAVAQSGFSRYPLVDAEGQPTGYLHLKDVLELDDFRQTLGPVAGNAFA